MRLRLLFVGLGLALLLAAFWSTEASWPASTRAPVAAAGLPDVVEPDPLPSPPSRDIFRYAETPVAAPRPSATRPLPASLVATPTVAPAPDLPLRLVGLVRRADGLRAAVATSAGVVLVGPGDLVSGYTVLGVDEERGLRLRGPDGDEHVLSN